MKLTLDGLWVLVGGFSLALDVELELTDHVTVVCGPSGAGKTTFLETLAGLRRPSAGRVQLGDEVLDDPAARLHLAPPRRRIGYVPQDLALFPNLTVRGNLLFSRRHDPVHASGPAQIDAIIAVLQLGTLLERPIAGLSGGERQRVALGRALISTPLLLLLDEPLAALDTELRETLLEYMLRVRDELRVPMLYVTHDARDAAVLAGRILRFAAGRLVAQGGPEEMLEPDPRAVRWRPAPKGGGIS